MSAQQHSWERRLLAWAAEGLEYDPPVQTPMRDARHLDRAYAYCDKIACEQGRTFYKASELLPDEKRRAVRALYAFCRITDDMIDRAGDEPEAALATWKQRSLVAPPEPDDLVVLAWADTRARYRIPTAYAEQLIDGVARDLTTTRYTSFDDLAAYCYGVASTVGLLSMHIIGFAGREAIPYAVKLGVALQITNILRDVREDWAAGRVYLPQDELAAFGLSDADIGKFSTAGFHDEGGAANRWRASCVFRSSTTVDSTTRQCRGSPGSIPPAGSQSLRPPGCLRDVLEVIAGRDGDVFTRQPHPDRTALPRAIRLWWQLSRRLPAAEAVASVVLAAWGGARPYPGAAGVAPNWDGHGPMMGANGRGWVGPSGGMMGAGGGSMMSGSMMGGGVWLAGDGVRVDTITQARARATQAAAVSGLMSRCTASLYDFPRTSL